MSDPTPPDESAPDFGPRGYLPERASKRARKIVLRAPMGMQWIVGAAVAGVVVLVAGLLFLARGSAPPGPPFVAVGAVDAIGEEQLEPDLGIVLSGAAGRIRAFAIDGEDAPRYCAASRKLESADGRVWSLTGRGLDGGPSLVEHPTQAHDGTLYVDPTRTVPGPAPTDDDVQAQCT